MPGQLPVSKFGHSLISDPITVGDRTVRAVARVSGFKITMPGRRDGSADGEPGDEPQGRRRGRRRGQPRGGTGSGAGALLKVSPVEFIVRDGEGEPYRVTVRDPGAEAMRGIVTAALAIAGISIVVSIMAGLVRGARD